MDRATKAMSLGPKLAFLTSLVASLAFWPAGCHSRSGTETPPTGSDSAANDPAGLVKAGSVPNELLPHPAFAYAKSAKQATSIADVAERVTPSVVNVASSRTVSMDQFFDNPFFRHFFGPLPEGEEMPEREQQGMGSGVIVSKDGIVLTNNHVVEDADEIQITTADRREFEAKIVGTDPKSDLAVVKIEGNPEGLQPIEFGDSSKMRLGDIVLAIGNPFGVGQTTTMGIVSATGRANVGIVDYEDFLQTDAAINPGNSGGALVNMKGELIGTPTAILSRTGGYMGIGFAIPSAMAKPIMDSLIEHGKVVRGWLGVSIQDVNKDLAEAMNLETQRGVLISEVMEGSPAAKAGLRQGDVVLELNGEKVESTGKLRNAVAAAGAGEKIELKIIRDGKTQTATVELGELPEEISGPEGVGPEPQQGATLDGLRLETLTPTLRQSLEIPESVKSGVVVVGLEPGSPAARAGLEPGDVVLEVNKEKVADVEAFRQAYEKAEDQVLLLVSRGARRVFMVVKKGTG